MNKTLIAESEIINESLKNKKDEIDIPSFMKDIKPSPIIYEQRKANIKSRRKIKVKTNKIVQIITKCVNFTLFVCLCFTFGQLEHPDTNVFIRLLTAIVQVSFSYPMFYILKNEWPKMKKFTKWVIFESWKEDGEDIPDLD